MTGGSSPAGVRRQKPLLGVAWAWILASHAGLTHPSPSIALALPSCVWSRLAAALPAWGLHSCSGRGCESQMAHHAQCQQSATRAYL